MYRCDNKVFETKADMEDYIACTQAQYDLQIEKIKADILAETMQKSIRVRKLLDERAALESDLNSRNPWRRKAARKNLFKHKIQHGDIIE